MAQGTHLRPPFSGWKGLGIKQNDFSAGKHQACLSGVDGRGVTHPGKGPEPGCACSAACPLPTQEGKKCLEPSVGRALCPLVPGVVGRLILQLRFPETGDHSPLGQQKHLLQSETEIFQQRIPFHLLNYKWHTCQQLRLQDPPPGVQAPHTL